MIDMLATGHTDTLAGTSNLDIIIMLTEVHKDKPATNLTLENLFVTQIGLFGSSNKYGLLVPEG